MTTNKAERILSFAIGLSACMLVAFLFFSRSLMSISTGLFVFFSFFIFFQSKNFQFNSLQIVSMLIFIFGAISFFYSENSTEAWRKIILKLPIFLMPFTHKAISTLSKNTIILISFFFISATYITGTSACINYFLNSDYYQMLVLESKPIPIITGFEMYHIEFSVINALSILIGFYLIVRIKSNFLLKIILSLMTSINVLSLHILSARTGLFAFYFTLFLSILFYTWSSGVNRKFTWIALLSLFVLPFVAYMYSGSLQNRIENTITDIKQIKSNGNPNDYSLFMRLEAWKNALQIIKNNPAGVGIGDTETMIQKQYEQDNSLLELDNRKNPHNQFLETAVQSGIITMLLLLLLFLVAVNYFIVNKNITGFAFVFLFLFSFLFESMLERQDGLLAFMFFMFFLQNPFFNKDQHQ